jgi:hypothetical protein
LQTIFSELGRNTNEEVTNAMTTILGDMQAAKNTWIQTDENLAGNTSDE